MTYEAIQKLLNKYFDGETTLEEESQLKAYFSTPSVDERLKTYQPLFAFFEQEKKTTTQREYRLQPTPYLRLVKSGWRMAAAIAILIMGCFFIYKQMAPTPKSHTASRARVIILDENSDPQIALEEIHKALNLVSKKMKKGQTEAEESLLKVKSATEKVFNDH